MALKPVSKSTKPARITSGHAGIGNNASAHVAQVLSGLLASTYALYQKSLYYHWNVEGANFFGLHALFEQHYQELHTAGDTLAERIRALGHRTPGTMSEFSALSRIKEDRQLPGDWRVMVGNLLQSHEQCSAHAREVLNTAEEASDEVTVDLMVQRMTFHDKASWMLRSLLA